MKFKSFEQKILCAKVSGPLMSMTASGAFAGTMVFAQRLGKSVVRHLVTPANPQTANQMSTRNAVSVAGAGQKFANTDLLLGAGRTVTDKAALKAVTPAGQTWNAFLVKCIIGKGEVNYTAATAAHTALGATPIAAWETAAAALTPAILAVAQKAVGGAAATPLSAGTVYFHYQYGLSIALGVAAPGAVPPVYA